MKVTRKLRLHFDPPEAGVLREMFADLEALITEPDPGDPVIARLNPAARPDDEQAAAEFRALTESALQDERLARLAACRADLVAGSCELADPDAQRRWLQTLNELRLALGTRLGIGEDDAPWSPAGADDPRTVYHWLTAVQDTIVAALLDRLDR